MALSTLVLLLDWVLLVQTFSVVLEYFELKILVEKEEEEYKREARELEERKARRIAAQLEEPDDEPFWQWEIEIPGLCSKYIGMDDFCYDRISEANEICDDNDDDVCQQSDAVQKVSEEKRHENVDKYADFFSDLRD